MTFLERFLAYLSDLAAEGRDALVVGDLNVAHAEIDPKNWRANRRTSGFLPEERAWPTEALVARARGFTIPRAPVVSDHAPVPVDYGAPTASA